MIGLETIYFSQSIQQPQITFNIEKVQQIYDNYTINYHAGLTMVMGHPFNDKKFRKKNNC